MQVIKSKSEYETYFMDITLKYAIA